jgi:hypothetical protein
VPFGGGSHDASSRLPTFARVAADSEGRLLGLHGTAGMERGVAPTHVASHFRDPMHMTSPTGYTHCSAQDSRHLVAGRSSDVRHVAGELTIHPPLAVLGGRQRAAVPSRRQTLTSAALSGIKRCKRVAGGLVRRRELQALIVK